MSDTKKLFKWALQSKMSYTKLTDRIFYGIHPMIVKPDLQPDNYVLLCPEIPRMRKRDIRQLDENLLANTKEEHDLLQQTLKARVYYYDLPDRSAPEPETLLLLAREISNLRGTVYIACRGGHGRSGVVAAAVYRLTVDISVAELLKYTKACWKRDRDMSYIRPHIRKLGSPQTAHQKRVLRDFCTLIKM